MSWTLYRAGKYDRTPPKAPGLYPVAALDGGFRGYVYVETKSFGKSYTINGRTYTDPLHAHAGFWWSVPVPPQRSANDEEMARTDVFARSAH